jgi:hypothetical protein
LANLARAADCFLVAISCSSRLATGPEVPRTRPGAAHRPYEHAGWARPQQDRATGHREWRAHTRRRRAVVPDDDCRCSQAHQHKRQRGMSRIPPRRHRPGLKLADGRDGVVYSSVAEWGYYSNRQKVRVAVAGDPYTGRVGVVQRTSLEGGEVVHVVQFQGEPGDYPPAAKPTAYCDLRRDAKRAHYVRPEHRAAGTGSQTVRKSLDRGGDGGRQRAGGPDGRLGWPAVAVP